MSKKLEDFIRHHKNAFEDYVPSDGMWQQIESKLDVGKETKPKAKVFAIKSWMKVAAIIALVVTTAVVFYNLDRKQIPAVEVTKGEDNIGSDIANDTSDNFAQEQMPVENDTPANDLATADIKKQENIAPQKSTGEDELYHYTKLIEIKQGQMKELKKTEPELYNQFAKDAEMLETSYDALKAQLSKGVNSEKLIEAMIGNLKMQSSLLNRQLEILKQVHSKSGKDESKVNNL